MCWISFVPTDLFSLKIDNAVLSSVLEAVLISGDGVIGQDLGESVSAASVHEVSEEFNISGSELLLTLHVNIGEISLANLGQEIAD